jgi:hypothetical protein
MAVNYIAGTKKFRFRPVEERTEIVEFPHVEGGVRKMLGHGAIRITETGVCEITDTIYADMVAEQSAAQTPFTLETILHGDFPETVQVAFTLPAFLGYMDGVPVGVYVKEYDSGIGVPA